MKEIPIIFSAPMVRAIRENRKTVTRRLVKPQPLGRAKAENRGMPGDLKLSFLSPSGICRLEESRGRNARATGRMIERDYSPYGQPGDVLWVRETWSPWRKTSYEGTEWDHWQGPRFDGDRPDSIEYKADCPDAFDMRWRSPIHMPRWASRITLEVVSVRVERLQDITEDDAKAEGVHADTADSGGTDEHGRFISVPDYTSAYMRLWNEINPDHQWYTNPWVWRVEFKRKDGGK